MLNVICARWGTDFRDYAERLQSMVARYLTVPHKFKCFADDELAEYAPAPFWQYKSGHRETLYRGYPLLFCFNPKLPIEGRTLFLGLDVLITAPIDDLVAMPGELVAIRDWWQGNLNNSVMLYDAGSRPDVFNDFPPENAESKTEQDWLNVKFPNAATWPDEWVRSYKIHCRDGMPEGCKVVVFHGEPKNHQVRDPWVQAAWK